MAFRKAYKGAFRKAFVGQLGANMNLREQLDNYIISLALTADETEEIIDIIAISKWSNVYRTMLSNDAMLTLESKNKTIIVNEKLSNELIVEGDFSNGGVSWVTAGDSTVNTGVGRVYTSDGSLSYIQQTDTIEGAFFYKNVMDVIGTPVSSATVGNSGNYRNITYKDANSNLNFHFICEDTSYFIKRRGSTCDVYVDNISVKKVINNIFSSIGDSIATPYSYSNVLESERNYFMYDHSVGGENIMDNMAEQVLAAASDNADFAILNLGTNDTETDVSVLQAEIELGISNYKLSNPDSKVYYLGCLPRWTDITGVTEVDRSHVRTAQKAACISQGANYLDTYTTPLITSADTMDGLHPTNDAHLNIIYPFLAERLPELF